MEFYPYQKAAIEQLDSGKILCGGVGSGKSLTALGYFLERECHGKQNQNLFIITTARKRDTGEWEKECEKLDISAEVDSWNNVKKYEDRVGFFLFDEQRVIGSGAWVKSFLKIALKNRWILLSATPGDSWSDYIPVFVANGYFRNRSDFLRQHAVFSRFAKYPKVERYIGVHRLEQYRDLLLVRMDFQRERNAHHEFVEVRYSEEAYKKALKARWNPYKDQPCIHAGEMCQVLRRIVGSDITRAEEAKRIAEAHERLIVFYNYNYELDILRGIDWGREVREWNGQKHEDIPDTRKWVYLVQYTAGSEGWNCILTDTILFYSLNYSYKVMTQAAGRTDRVNTPYSDLYYYYLRANAPIEKAVQRALHEKREFNERRYLGW